MLAERDLLLKPPPIDGAEMRRIRKDVRGVSLTSLSRATGFSIGYLSDLERGRWPGYRAGTAEKIARALGVDVSMIRKSRDAA